MDTRNLERAVELFAALMSGEEINRSAGKNTALYDAYNTGSEVSELLDVMLKKLNLKLYEYNYGLFLTPGGHNRVFGFTNEELKRVMGLRLNRELYLCYFIIYNIIIFECFNLSPGSWKKVCTPSSEDESRRANCAAARVRSVRQAFSCLPR